jgi:hypothetical protein
MSPHPTWVELQGFERAVRPQACAPDARPGWSARLAARLFATRYDRELESGVVPVPGTPLAVHCTRLAGAAERAQLMRALRIAVADATAPGFGRHPRPPIRRAAMIRASDVAAEVLDLLDGPRRVRVRGMARLRLLLSDGRGPLYRAGAGSLDAALRGVLAALWVD